MPIVAANIAPEAAGDGSGSEDPAGGPKRARAPPAEGSTTARHDRSRAHDCLLSVRQSRFRLGAPIGNTSTAPPAPEGFNRLLGEWLRAVYAQIITAANTRELQGAEARDRAGKCSCHRRASYDHFGCGAALLNRAEVRPSTRNEMTSVKIRT